MSEKQPIQIFKQGTAAVYIRPVTVDGILMGLLGVSDMLFTIKASSLDDAAIVEHQTSVTGTPTNVSNAEAKITFTEDDLDVLVPGDYVAELQIEKNAIWHVGDTWIFRVVPQIGAPT